MAKKLRFIDALLKVKVVPSLLSIEVVGTISILIMSYTARHIHGGMKVIVYS